MLSTSEIPTQRLVLTLRALVQDLCSVHSPFNKDEEYLHNVAEWIAAAASRIEELQPKDKQHPKGSE